jgi:MtN3 and saliva related transmembrane protein
MDTATLVGLVAGFLTTAAFVPQLLKIWNTRSARDVSLPAFGTFALGLVGWLAFGILKQDFPIILWNAVTLVLAVAILAMKMRFG